MDKISSNYITIVVVTRYLDDKELITIINMKRVTSSACRMWARVLSPLDCWIICISLRQKNAEQLSEHLNWNSYTVKIRVLRCLRACGCMRDISISVLDLFHLIGMVFICFQTFIIKG